MVKQIKRFEPKKKKEEEKVKVVDTTGWQQATFLPRQSYRRHDLHHYRYSYLIIYNPKNHINHFETD